MLTYGDLLEILQSFDENQLKKPAMIYISDSEYVQQAQQVVVSDDDSAPVIIADIYIQFEDGE